MILPAQLIRRRQVAGNMVGLPLIEPFFERSKEQGMTFGLGPSGYDVRIKQRLDLAPSGAPGSFALASTIERFNLPDDLDMTIFDKSSWARLGVSLFNTVAEAGWRGYLTLEIVNQTAWAITIPEGSPIAQVKFHRLSEPTEQPYRGKYQDQPNEPVMTRWDF